jgi:hypothetical protein
LFRSALSGRNPRITYNQRSDEAQESLMLGMALFSAEKRADIDLGHLSPGGQVCLVPDTHAARIRIAGEKPLISVWVL